MSPDIYSIGFPDKYIIQFLLDEEDYEKNISKINSCLVGKQEYESARFKIMNFEKKYYVIIRS